MNRAKYKGDARYERVLITMDLLGIMDVSTTIQARNGTIVWKLPIKNHDNRNPSFIEVASFKTGYVRNQNSGYSNYQLNKRCEGEPEYFELANGDYRKFTVRSCKLIPIEIDRLEYLISYCLKNYYIKRANQVVEGKYVSQWYHEYEMNRLQNKLANSVPKWKYDEANQTYGENTGAINKLHDLENKLATIKRISDYETK